MVIIINPLGVDYCVGKIKWRWLIVWETFIIDEILVK